MWKLIYVTLLFNAIIMRTKCDAQSSLDKKVKILHPSEKGSIILNGKIPTDFKIPIDTLDYTVNYIGQIKKSDFAILPFDTLNIFCPEFLKGTLFIDYSNPAQPVYLNENNIGKSNYPEGKGFKLKEYLPIRLKLNAVENFNQYYFGQTGEPAWIQNPEVPISLKSNKQMDFLIQFSFDPFINKEFQNKNYFKYPPTMYIYIEPETKIIAIKLQST